MVAENLIRSGKRVLVVGSEANALVLNSPVYWDIASSETFLQAFERSLLDRPDANGMDTLKEFFRERLAVPTGH